jgi:hypothetical protein
MHRAEPPVWSKARLQGTAEDMAAKSQSST